MLLTSSFVFPPSPPPSSSHNLIKKMVDNNIARTLVYGILLNLFFFLTVRDLLTATPRTTTPADNEEEPDVFDKSIPQPKLMTMDMPGSSGPVLKFLFWWVFLRHGFVEQPEKNDLLHPRFVWLIDWLIDWLNQFGLADWLVQWVVDWLIDWLIDWISLGWLIDWFSGLSIDWLIDWLIESVWVGWLTGSVGCRSIDWLIDWLIYWFIEWLIDCLIAWFNGLHLIHKHHWLSLLSCSNSCGYQKVSFFSSWDLSFLRE